MPDSVGTVYGGTSSLVYFYWPVISTVYSGILVTFSIMATKVSCLIMYAVMKYVFNPTNTIRRVKIRVLGKDIFRKYINIAMGTVPNNVLIEVNMRGLMFNPLRILDNI